METETPPPDYETHRSSAGPSWPLLLALAAVICGTALQMVPNVWYTAGASVQFLYIAAIGLTALFVLAGFVSRILAARLILASGALLILGQAYQTRRWGIIQEEVIAILNYARQQKAATGAYPTNLDTYSFRHPETRSRIRYSFYEGKLMVSYDLHDGDAHFWHHEEGGFLFNGD